MKTLLVPVDFSPQTRQVIAEAVALALPSGARIILLHVLQSPDVLADYGTAGSYLLPVMASTGRDASLRLASWRRRITAKGIEVTVVQLTGAARAQLIAKEAARSSADYVVMGSHGHTAFYDVVAGGTTNAVLKLAPCPVIVVPPARRPSRG